MKNIERYIYVGDIHGSEHFIEFIEEFNDGKTFFYLLGDLFDRGLFSYENFLVIKKLHQEGLLDLVLGNHDLFFIFSKGLKYPSEMNKYMLKNRFYDIPKFKDALAYYTSLYLYNGGENTDKSFINNTSDDEYNASESTKIAYAEVADYLWENFSISKIDHHNNLLVHGGIPILPSGDLVHIEYGKDIVGGMKLLEKMNEGFDKLDIEAIISLDNGIDNGKGYNTLSLMERFQENLITKDIYNFEGGRHLSPIWFDSSMYDKSDRVRNTLIEELNNNNIENIFVGHWHNREIDSEDFNNSESKYWIYNRVFRLDRSFVHGDFGYAIFDTDNNLQYTGSYSGDRNKKR